MSDGVFKDILWMCKHGTLVTTPQSYATYIPECIPPYVKDVIKPKATHHAMLEREGVEGRRNVGGDVKERAVTYREHR